MAREVIRVRNEFYIRSSSARVDVRTRVLKQGDTFAVFDRFGDIETFGTGELGLYYQDTRFLSRLTLKLGKDRPLLLSSTVREDNAVMAVDATNPDSWRDGEIVIPRGTLHVFRSKILWEKTCHERLRIHNYGRAAVDVSFAIEFDADFADIFELRGMNRERRGRRLETEVTKDGLVLAYEGLDNRLRRTRIVFDPAPTRLNESVATFQIRLEAGKDASYRCAIACEVDGDSRQHVRPCYESVVEEAASALERVRAREPQIFTGNEQFNDWLNRSLADLHMMRTETPYGPYPYAGVPWFSTVFGRDGIIAALQHLWFDPSIARGVLAYLAATQADADNPEQDAEPGKVIHEVRTDEMATLGEVPFKRYYGSIDATPLFIMLAGAYYRRTGDRAFTESIWPNIERALGWIDHYGDSDGDGFVEYARKQNTVSSIRAGKILTTRFSTRMALLPKDQSRFAKCRATFTLPRRQPASWPGYSVTHHVRANCQNRRKRSVADSRKRFGVTTFRLMRLPWTGASSLAECEPRTRGTVFSRVSRRRSMRAL